MKKGVVKTLETKKEKAAFLDELMDTFELWCVQEFGFYLYKYELRIARLLFYSLICEPVDVYVKIARQAGKTETVTLVLRFLLRMYYIMFGTPLMCAISSPKGEQAKTDIDRIKMTINILRHKWKIDDRENNANTIRAWYRNKLVAELFKFSLMPTTANESKTLNLAVFEERHKCNDTKISDEIDPMLASTGGVSWNFGVGCVNECQFRKGCEDELEDSVSLVVDCYEVFKDRRAVYEATGDDMHLEYEKKTLSEIRKKGKMNPEIRRNYFVHDLVEIGDYISKKRLFTLRRPTCKKCNNTYWIGKPEDQVECGCISMESLFVGIDLAKKQDETVVTIINEHADIIDWMVYAKMKYLDQIDLIEDDLNNRGYIDNIVAVKIDSTREETAFEAFLEKTEMPISEESGVIFTAKSKNTMYTALDQVLFTDEEDDARLSYPANHIHVEQFEDQMTELQREYKTENEYLSPHHKEIEGAHDDYCDSLALAILGATESGISDIMTVSEPDREEHSPNEHVLID